MNIQDLVVPAYAALDTFNRHIAGFLAACGLDAAASRIAVGRQIDVVSATVGEVKDLKPSMTLTDGDEVSAATTPVVIEKEEEIAIKMDGNQFDAATQNGTLNIVLKKAFEDAYGKLADRIEGYVAAKAAAGASRACGTAGTVPFGDAAKMTEVAQLANILDTNGAAQDDRHLILSPEALMNLRSNKENLIRADAFGSADFLHTGLLNTPLYGFKFWQSAGLKKHHCDLDTGAKTKGYTVTAGQAEGDTVIGVTGATGAKAITDGCVATFGTGTGLVQYVINKGCTGTGSVTIGAPGLLSTVSAATTMNFLGDFTPSVALRRNAIMIGVRAPALPFNKDGGEHRIVQDSVTGIPFDIGMYYGDHTSRISVSVAYGAAVVDPSNVALLIG